MNTFERTFPSHFFSLYKFLLHSHLFIRLLWRFVLHILWHLNFFRLLKYLPLILLRASFQFIFNPLFSVLCLRLIEFVAFSEWKLESTSRINLSQFIQFDLIFYSHFIIWFLFQHLRSSDQRIFHLNVTWIYVTRSKNTRQQIMFIKNRKPSPITRIKSPIQTRIAALDMLAQDTAV